MLFGELLLPGFYGKNKIGIHKNLPKLKNAIIFALRNELCWNLMIASSWFLWKKENPKG